MRCHKPDVKDTEKRKHKWKSYDICGVIYKKKSASWFCYENLKFQPFDIAFLILLSVFGTVDELGNSAALEKGQGMT